jgi:hypothetical protein
MLRLNARQRTVLLEKVPDVANLAIGALLFGQVVGSQPVSRWLALTGFLIWIVLMAITLSIAEEDRK